MSGGYASRLSYYAGKGLCGLPEREDSSRVLDKKLKTLYSLITTSSTSYHDNSQKIVVLTGAGISTAAGIPDFRGPDGIWTKEQDERKRKKRKRNKEESDKSSTTASASFSSSPSALFPLVFPTFTHMALSQLTKSGIVEHVITQNVVTSNKILYNLIFLISRLFSSFFLRMDCTYARPYHALN